MISKPQDPIFSLIFNFQEDRIIAKIFMRLGEIKKSHFSLPEKFIK